LQTRFLKFFNNLFKPKKKISDYERYLSEATDVYDLEKRERQWQRGKRA